MGGSASKIRVDPNSNRDPLLLKSNDVLGLVTGLAVDDNAPEEPRLPIVVSKNERAPSNWASVGGIKTFFFCMTFALIVSLEFGVGVIWPCTQASPLVTISQNLIDQPVINTWYWLTIFTFIGLTPLRYHPAYFTLRVTHFRSFSDWYFNAKRGNYFIVGLTEKVGEGKKPLPVVVGWKASYAIHMMSCIRLVSGIATGFFSGLVLSIKNGQVGSEHDIAAYALAILYGVWELNNVMIRIFDTFVFTAMTRMNNIVGDIEYKGNTYRGVLVSWSDWRYLPWTRVWLSVLEFAMWIAFIATGIESKVATPSSVAAQYEYALAMILVLCPLHYTLDL